MASWLHRLPAQIGLAACAVILAGCGGPISTAITDAPRSAAPLRLAALNALDARVARVAFRLSDANAALCPAIRQSAGWALHAASQYSEELRPYAQARFGLDGDLPGLLTVPAGSPAAIAGLQEGDLVLAVNGRALARGPDRREAAFEGLAANIAVIDRSLANGSTQLTVRRNGAEIPITVTPRRACGYEVQLNPSDELNARADGRRLFISTALAGFAETDDELAVILGHELAHHVLRHRVWNESGGAARRENESVWRAEGGEGGAEQQADRVGLYLAARAGYDPAVAAPFWRRFGASNWRVRFPQIVHASAESRARSLEAVRHEIELKQRAGENLVP